MITNKQDRIHQEKRYQSKNCIGNLLLEAHIDKFNKTKDDSVLTDIKVLHSANKDANYARES